MGYTHGFRWSEESIREKILEVVDFYHLDRMPSMSETEAYFGNSALTNAVTRRDGGWYKLAEDMNLSVKNCETTFGKTNEQIVSEILISQGFEVRRMPQNFPYDLLVNDCAKIDVKASKLYRGNGGNFYSFNLEKPFCTCDLYVLRMVNDNGSENDTLIIPASHVATNTQISVGESRSKYRKYSRRWDYIADYCGFMESVV